MRAKQSPGSLTFDELGTFLARSNWMFDRQKGSHRIWISPKNRVVSIQPDGKMAKSYQVIQILRIMESENG